MFRHYLVNLNQSKPRMNAPEPTLTQNKAREMTNYALDAIQNPASLLYVQKIENMIANEDIIGMAKSLKEFKVSARSILDTEIEALDSIIDGAVMENEVRR